MLFNLNETEISQVSGGSFPDPSTGTLIVGIDGGARSFSELLGVINDGDRDPRQTTINIQLARYIAAQKAEGVPGGQAHADFFLY